MLSNAAFGWLKHCRNLANRSDKLALNFLTWIKLAMIRQSLENQSIRMD
ncbi:DDE family transposase [Azospirillum baldaniorum]|nr:transposase [Azospirillum baldaniorum]TWA55986.1 DDE family transposase [Azospirillum baldaniorum]